MGQGFVSVHSTRLAQERAVDPTAPAQRRFAKTMTAKFLSTGLRPSQLALQQLNLLLRFSIISNKKHHLGGRSPPADVDGDIHA